MDAPLSAAAAAALAQAALEPEMHMICDAVAEHVRARTPVTGFRHFWELIAKTLKEKHGISRGHTSIQKEYEGLKGWCDVNRYVLHVIQSVVRWDLRLTCDYSTDEHVNVRKWVKNALRRASRQQASANEKRGGEEEKEDEEEGEDEGEAPSAFTMQLPLPSFGPPSAQAPPAGTAWTSS